jgi:DNA-binding transcriptional MerR regulator
MRAVPRRKAPSRSPPAERPFATTDELLDIIKMSRRTLYEWVQRSLLPIPRTMSNGDGVWSRWPRNSIDHARFIVEQRELGYAFDEIRPILHARWGSADKVPLEEVEAREAKSKAAKTKGQEEPS